MRDWRYKCEDCGCNLDPGEGSVCDECKEEQRKANVQKVLAKLSNLPHCDRYGQVFIPQFVTREYIELEEMVTAVRYILKECYCFTEEGFDNVSKFVKKEYSHCELYAWDSLKSSLLRGVRLGVDDIDGISRII